MKLYISGDTDEFQYNSVSSIENSDVVLILPGGLGMFYDLFLAIKLKKRVIIYNKDMYYAPLIKNLYNAYIEKNIDNAPSSYLEIESEKEIIIKKLEEK